MDEVLLVLYKPSGASRDCTPGDTAAVAEAWNAVLAWLQGADPDQLPCRDILSETAAKSALRMVRSPLYDITLWAHQADQIPHLKPSGETLTLPDLFGRILGSLGLRLAAKHACWLNRVAIELIYGTTPRFHQHRDKLTRRLLEGPVIAEAWEGDRTALAQSAKIPVRRALSGERQTNLIHMDMCPYEAYQQIISATGIP